MCFERGYPDNNCCLPAAYNEPANIELSPCPWDFWVDASFTYWTAYEGGLDLATSNTNSTFLTGVAGGVTIPVDTLEQETAWKPGFKVGLGVDLGHDHWSAYAEYTWFRSRTHTSKTASAAPAGASAAVWTVTGWSLTHANHSPIEISSTWHCNMDLLDVAATRPFYQGTHLIMAPFAGVRAAWIRQNLRLAMPVVLAGQNADAVYHFNSHSWAVGPRAGCRGEWHLGWGFRVEGDMAASINYTRYTSVNASADSLVFGSRVTADLSDYNAIRFNNDMNIGLGWGSYFDCRNYHFDLLVSYDFQIFWDQNMMRYLANEVATGVGAQPNNLYLQGLTVRAQFDF
ncbi:MAG: hypothetical protein KGI83_04630 [Verrucomicrobiota bacterium]|nr:hypothetical protein [Verrucomicrobiota bacterium]